ncbi:MAG: 16S rRNA (cytidine(1402)-2'-O)-methyltransferase [Candidatus Eremiobacteraeota bacterium]|nr:16S rRNA (cytidine(1402)-2'-O)-methyltransferase [Candidatus Eremiobacteraeota bacterium]
MPLTFVPTPLGNLRDITLRALDALRECDLLVAEDTRVARKLLNALNLPSKPLLSYREQNAKAVTAKIIHAARKENVAVVSDAGMPAISDPGADLIAAARNAGITIEALPGPSAVLGAAVLSGFDLHEFAFGGFLPRKSRARKAAFDLLAQGGRPTTVWFESPNRIRAALADLEAVDSSRRCFLLREYTKLHEQQIAGTASDVAAELSETVRGEIVLVVEGGGKQAAPVIDFNRAADALFKQRESVAAIAKTLAQRGFGPRREIYSRLLQRKERERRKR